ncbi:MAG: hypothetical protein JWP88_2157 [Flaviaesturariibacter sp.]|nr:hypothetical protein [Flaviaesturariibacter sp.]
MRTGLLFLMAFVSILSCQKKTVARYTEIAGRWQRTETLIDPGDGSGQFSPVSGADATVVEFKENGMLTAPGHWYLSRYNRFAVLSDTQLRLYTPANDSLTLTYSLASKLTINYQCIEACRDRFTKVD